MSDLKSKLPDMNELGSMAGKLFKDIKSSVCSIIDDYKQKHPDVKADEKKPVVKPEVVAKAEELNAETAIKTAKKSAEKTDVKNKNE